MQVVRSVGSRLVLLLRDLMIRRTDFALHLPVAEGAPNLDVSIAVKATVCFSKLSAAQRFSVATGPIYPLDAEPRYR